MIQKVQKPRLSLTVCLFPPELAAEFIARPQSQEVVEGEKAEFVCSVSKDTYDVKWFKNDKEITAGDKFDIVCDGKRRALIVKQCEPKDEGSYVAFIGSTKASAELYVIGKYYTTSVLLINLYTRIKEDNVDTYFL